MTPLAQVLQKTYKSINGTTWFARVGLGGVGFFLVFVLLLHFLETEYNPVSRFVSQYALGDYGYLMNIAFILLGIGTANLAIGLNRDSNPGHRIASALLGVSATMIIVAGLFNPDPSLPEIPSTTSDLVHFWSVASPPRPRALARPPCSASGPLTGYSPTGRSDSSSPRTGGSPRNSPT